MSNFIIGTAGHIDHGKTSLIKALTGFETDRLKEEKERGISIDLGFSYFELADGSKAGIIDVPGHERFLNNMLAGVVGMDLILFVVAADEGVMPQTVEHLNILNLIGVKNGIIVITKSDMVDDDMLELVADDIRESFKDTFLENAKIAIVSSKTGAGIEDLKDEIRQAMDNVPPRSVNKPARLPIDRVFTLKGIGTVITGTVIEGIIRLNDEVSLFPQNTIQRVRNIQVHNQNENTAFAGQRAAINLASTARHEIKRGEILAEKDSLHISNMLDVELILLADTTRTIRNGSRVHLFVGTAEAIGTVVLFDRKELTPGNKCFGQLRIDQHLSTKHGDKFIVRFYSPLETIGGGTIIDPNPSKKKPLNPSANELCQKKHQSDFVSVIIAFVEEHDNFISMSSIRKTFSLNSDDIDDIMRVLVDMDLVIELTDNDQSYYIHKDNYHRLCESLLEEIKQYNKKYNLKPGINKETLMKNIRIDFNLILFNKLLLKMKEEGLIKLSNEFISKPDFSMRLNEEQELVFNKINTLLEQEDRIIKKETILELDKGGLILDYLIFNKKIEIINNELVINITLLNDIKDVIIRYLNEHQKITVSDARDLIGTSRKKAILILEYLDMKRITQRNEDFRTLL
ncbi:MAG: Selenocysteine-specific translation elongation factor [Clostridiales bacterium 38_11]|nr:MAG: Selenocysteine-specific translation elongation factor [Clostridiales bacterium 38_11]HBH12059.1 selenocysteine-specific translation elongation factor [Clostridiales bacterium]